MRDRPYPDDMAHGDPLEAESDAAVVTPRGGFMARPGLKSPPRHAVVVRMGDAPVSEHIPVARESVAPPAPLEPGPVSSSDDKVTLRAIPAPSAAASPPPPVESIPPPSDTPVVASIRAPELATLPSKRSRRAGVTIVLASAAGVVLGLASVALTRLGGDEQAASTEPATVLAVAPLAPQAAAAAAPLPSLEPGISAAAPSSSVAPAPKRAPSGERRSIF